MGTPVVVVAWAILLNGNAPLVQFFIRSINPARGYKISDKHQKLNKI